MKLYQTSRAGDSLRQIEPLRDASPAEAVLAIDPGQAHQTIVGIGGAFTESAADALASLPKDRRSEVLEAYFSPERAAYSLMRTHIASCDFSLGNYTYLPEPEDTNLASFSIERDRELLLPLIHDSQSVRGAQFRILASPWTVPPWMKNEATWNGGALRPEHRQTFADYLCRYIQAYEREGVPIWALTPLNEPEGNGDQWESTYFTAQEMADFLGAYLGPTLERHGLSPRIYMFDHNRDHMRQWADTIYRDKAASRFVEGMAVHWYSSTVSAYEEELAEIRRDYPEMEILHSEGCIDVLGDDEPLGSWMESDWWWREEATDWGHRWAPDDLKKDHPRYVPVYRYARDLVRGLGAGMSGWIDWNIVLDARGGPNHAENYCGAPVMVDRGTGDVLYTPLYYVMSHFSRFVRPGAKRVEVVRVPDSLEAVAFRNPDGSLAVVVLNDGDSSVRYQLTVQSVERALEAPPESIQTLVL